MARATGPTVTLVPATTANRFQHYWEVREGKRRGRVVPSGDAYVALRYRGRRLVEVGQGATRDEAVAMVVGDGT